MRALCSSLSSLSIRLSDRSHVLRRFRWKAGDDPVGALPSEVLDLIISVDSDLGEKLSRGFLSSVF